MWTSNPSATTDDPTFINALLTNLSSTYCVDTGRVFASGMSNGGGFTNIIACNATMSLRFAAFAPHSAAVYPNYGQCPAGNSAGITPLNVNTSSLIEYNEIGCTPGRQSQPIMEFHGTSDGTILYQGDPNHSGWCLPQIPHLMNDWLDNIPDSSGHALIWCQGNKSWIFNQQCYNSPGRWRSNEVRVGSKLWTAGISHTLRHR